MSRSQLQKHWINVKVAEDMIYNVCQALAASKVENINVDDPMFAGIQPVGQSTGI